MDPLIEKARADYEQVTAEISKLAQKQAKLRAFLSAYDVADSADPDPLGVSGHPIAPDVRPLPPTSVQFIQAEPQTAKARITNAVAAILADGIPRHTRSLLDALKLQGLEPGAADKVIGLSNLLSRDPRFQASRSYGWSLKE